MKKNIIQVSFEGRNFDLIVSPDCWSMELAEVRIIEHFPQNKIFKRIEVERKTIFVDETTSIEEEAKTALAKWLVQEQHQNAIRKKWAEFENRG